MNRKHVIIGTAGHIDHGKSALLKSLTGVDPDRLKEEQERGMTTDLGFVFYSEDVTVIDVPGHEKFVRHMVAGANTIDIVLFVVAADDGIMPQTVEHLEILKLLAIPRGIIVLTKKDLVEPEMLEVVTEDMKQLVKGSFLENAPIVSVSNVTHEGMDDLRKVLDTMIAQPEERKDKGIFRMPIDRCFTMKGFGTVVAGTVLSGIVHVGDALELLPQKKQVKVRSIEVHNKKVPEIGTGYRIAINLAGAEKEEIVRGDVLAQPDFYEPSQYVNASLYLLKSSQPLKNFARLRIHVSAKEILGRAVLLDTKSLEPGNKAMVQFRLESSAVCDVNDRYVVRTYSPQYTVGGGVIIEPRAEKAKGFDEQLIEHLQRVESAEPIVLVEEELLSNFELPRKVDEIAHDINLNQATVKEILTELIKGMKIQCLDEKRAVYYHIKNLNRLKDKAIEVLKEYHKNNPTNIGMPQLELLKKISPGLDKTLLNYVLGIMSQEKSVKMVADNKVSLHDFTVAVDSALNAIIKNIERLFLDAGFMPPDYDTIVRKKLGPENQVSKAYKYMLDSGMLINIGESIVMHQKTVNEAREKLIQFLKKNPEIRVHQFRDILGATRKYVVPLMVYFDTHNVTIKRGEVRVLGLKYR